MTRTELEAKREAVESALESTWTLFDEVRLYVAPDNPAPPDPPDFSRRAAELVPEPLQEAATLLERVSLAQLGQMVETCHLCQLGTTRTKVVVGEGMPNARLMVIGEGPGAEEDKSGRPFVGRAGQYLDAWLNAIGLDRKSNTYIANIVKCRPPGNRDPLPEEAMTCMPYLKRQIALVKPDGILCVGKVAAHFLLGREDALRSMRDAIHRFEGIPVVVTYHPAAVLRNLELRAPVWEDLKRLANVLGLPIPQTRR